ncbi:S8/S53 family peptidase [Tessaracoccus palaemonis]|uniref:S8/S53 family peptidase n=1 Tax=Tessaracoccus palaemonis TaxID=2829499 RepID=A0ABX8SJU7_9ACTN|nr:S8/S53 family peptidase [Tessaracoccus palaemonis]QXT63154.1 S8/S53 family peptidase [Tessaracoccus palaemonis]
MNAGGGGELQLLEGGGADATGALLGRYAPATDSWDLPMGGEFWEAVRSAHGLGRRGAGRVIAIIDGGFDATLPAIARHPMAWDQDPYAGTTHGTVVALLTHQVAPEAQLLLYPASADGRLSLDRVLAALRDCLDRRVDVVNLSLGLGIPMADASPALAADDATPSAARPDVDDPAENLDVDDWRRIINVPHSPLWLAARAAAAGGVSVICSTGNSDTAVYVPAVVPGVMAVGFQLVARTITTGMEEAVSKQPTFVQSHFADLLIVQPAGVLGSSFASPLLAGFAALMTDRMELPDFARCARRAANASGAMLLLEQGDGDNEFLNLVDSLFKEALRSSPHPHYDGDVYAVPECPECALFAAPAYNDFGLFAMATGRLDVAVRLFATLRQIAPTNSAAAANLGVAFSEQARHAAETGNHGEAAWLYELAVGHMGNAVALRPEHQPYAQRLTEFRLALAAQQSAAPRTPNEGETP